MFVDTFPGGNPEPHACYQISSDDERPGTFKRDHALYDSPEEAFEALLRWHPDLREDDPLARW